MNTFLRLGVVPALVLLFLTAGCTSSRWQYLRTRPTQTATTKVTVRTDPSGAEVSINGDYLGEAPVVVPVMYNVEVKVYGRRTVFPYPQRETRELKTWVQNVFTFSAIKTGYSETKAEVTLRGNEEREITIKLHPKQR